MIDRRLGQEGLALGYKIEWQLTGNPDTRVIALVERVAPVRRSLPTGALPLFYQLDFSLQPDFIAYHHAAGFSNRIPG
jgi:hypothetical protein